ncbi:bacillithiol biosynthesis cysteine-adding enzyme BshC [Gracilibacillus sp. YIM 98692]|uniref:bacillithiol biosynthesis cysteine-adding enzyme BshC n=1 Tax=Gracilibacillus sp. YIM 98692 TaxID=2663532 RepID=UPI0013D4E816|nr:bacillithiol biosynthesis cysteine-adding enzyme BshC [Gracilibacillus sp. YIM 98692]
MRIEPMKLNTSNKFVRDYIDESKKLMSFFDYNPYEQHTYQQRLRDLMERTFHREELTNVLYQLNQRWKGSSQTLENINKLNDSNSVVIIGGQQAGLLSGPLYTIHKIISIIQLAKEKEKTLRIPVIPVFWIAGEDHDYEEVNHIFLPDSLKKHALKDERMEKTSISNRQIDTDQLMAWIETAFIELKETAFTKDIYQLIRNMAEESDTLVDFFAKMIHYLFDETGLVLIDSGDVAVRQLESNIFKTLITKQEEISSGVFQTLQQMRTAGYSVSVSVEENEGHLFFHDQGERILLKKDGDYWVGKNGECRFSTEEMIRMATNTPELLSNNVVTRPIMQECLFPTLAFLGGPSEVGYWSILKPAFRSLSMKVPPALPRLSFTFVEGYINKKIQKFGLDLLEVISKGPQVAKQKWLAAQSNPSIHRMGDQLKEVIDQNHRPLQEFAYSLQDDIHQYAEKNLQYLKMDVDQLVHRLASELEKKYSSNLDEFDLIMEHLHPNGGLQERVWNILYYLNSYDKSFIYQMIDKEYDYQQQHYVVYL